MKTKEYFTSNLSAMQTDMLYLLMVNRLAKHYSAAELTFLMGEQAHFIQEFERLQRVGFGTKMIYKLGNIFGHYNFNYGIHKGVSHHIAEYSMTITEMPDKTIYTLERIIHAYESVIIFQLQEGLQQFNFEDRPNIREREAIAIVLQTAINQGLFDKPINATHVFDMVKGTLKRQASPTNLQHELERLVGRKGKAPLKLTHSQTIGYRYVKHKNA